MKLNVTYAVGLAALLALTSNAYAAKTPKEFIKDAIQGDNSEIMLGQLAQDKGASQQVKDFGLMLVTDHTKAKAEASALAKTLNVTPPDQPMSEAKMEQEKLSKLTGNAFDHEFARYMVTDHEKDIKAFEVEAKAKAGETSTLAEKTLPDLKKHLEMAQSISKQTPMK